MQVSVGIAEPYLILSVLFSDTTVKGSFTVFRWDYVDQIVEYHKFICANLAERNVFDAVRFNLCLIKT